MSLITPPSTSHRNKENRPGASGARVVWSTDMVQLRRITGSPPPQGISPASASKRHPIKSILKPPRELLPFPNENEKEPTPEPCNPLSDQTYLEHPVSKIISSDASLRDLVEAYSVLAARLRSSVTSSTDGGASWPLFQPLRKNRDAIVEAFIRDLGRALTDPGCTESLDEVENFHLPSPKSSPSPKRKRGMTASQVTYARDLSTTSLVVMRLLAVVFTLPAVFRIFDDAQLCAVLTGVLGIPLAPELPTPNARKTYALSIWLLQVQRLPPEVLRPANDRIASALRRGMEGELGKEGKKGSASDGLKAIHDLAVYQPSTFIPAFTDLLPSILSNLLAPTLALRTQACHALGGFVLGCTSLPASPIHTHIASTVSTFITTLPTPSRKASTSTISQESTIIRTLRTTLSATEPVVAAQGPVWALSVLASFIVLLGPGLYLDTKLTRIISALLSLSMRHKKSSVRALGCLVWRCVSWAYFQHPFPLEGGDKKEVDQAVVDEGRGTYWKVVRSVVDLGAGVATIAGLLGDDSMDEGNLRRTMALLNIMIAKGGQACSDAMEIVKHFVSTASDKKITDWDCSKLLPQSLFSACPGLLTTEYKSLVHVVKPILDQCPQLDDVRSLSREEIATEWVFEELVKLWKEGLHLLEIPGDSETPTEITAIWDGLLKANIGVLQDEGDEEGQSEFTIRAVTILGEILRDEDLDLRARTSSEFGDRTDTSPLRGSSKPVIPTFRTKAALKLSLTHDLWTRTRAAVPHEVLGVAGEKLLGFLMEFKNDVLWDTDAEVDARREWAMLCADVLVFCDVDELKAFWMKAFCGTTVVRNDEGKEWVWSPYARSTVWNAFMEMWRRSNEGSWEGCVVLLGVPFADMITWELSNEDFEMWDELLRFTRNKALDFGIDSVTVLDHLAETISRQHTPAFVSSLRVADLLLTHLDISDARQIPEYLFGLINDVFIATYPPEPRNKITSMWMIRSFTRVVDNCPAELSMGLFETMHDGICTWVSDECQVFSQEEYIFDILLMYQTTLLAMRALPVSLEVLDNLSGILQAPFCGYERKISAASEAFQEFWRATYYGLREPDGGWPVRVQTCLESTFPVVLPIHKETRIVPLVDSAYDPDTSQDDGIASPNTPISSFEVDMDELWWPESEEEEEDFCSSTSVKTVPNQSVKSRLGNLGPAFVTQEAVVPDVFTAFQHSTTEGPTSTPTNSAICPSTPPRPRKSSSRSVYPLLPLRLPTTPPFSVSQRTPVTPKRTSFSRSGSSSSVRRKMVNKENESSYAAIASVADRIAMRSPICSSLGKRPGHGEAGSPKKRKTNSGFVIPLNDVSHSSGSDNSEEDRIVQSALLDGVKQSPSSAMALPPKTAASGPTTSLIKDAAGPLSKKRKRLFMDAVMLPTLAEVNRRLKQRTTPSQSIVADDVYLSSADGSSSRRRKRRRNIGPMSELVCDPFLTTLRALQDVPVAGSDDSIMSTGEAAPELSSDDDPHLGQVSPHCLTSPSLRRQGNCQDPPSDDSNMSDSPSRNIVTRRLQRLGSITNVRAH